MIIMIIDGVMMLVMFGEKSKYIDNCINFTCGQIFVLSPF